MHAIFEKYRAHPRLAFDACALRKHKAVAYAKLWVPHSKSVNYICHVYFIVFALFICLLPHKTYFPCSPCLVSLASVSLLCAYKSLNHVVLTLDIQRCDRLSAVFWTLNILNIFERTLRTSCVLFNFLFHKRIRSALYFMQRLIIGYFHRLSHRPALREFFLLFMLFALHAHAKQKRPIYIRAYFSIFFLLQRFKYVIQVTHMRYAATKSIDRVQVCFF